MAKNQTSTRLADFPAEELEHLVIWYPYIRRQLCGCPDGPNVMMPKVRSANEALRVLREFEARGDLWIRITASGNLNVDVHQAEYDDGPDSRTYSPLIKQPSMARLAQRLREHPGEDPFSGWRFTLLPETLESRSRWEEAEPTGEPDPELELKLELDGAQRALAVLIVREFPNAEESAVRRITERAAVKLQGLLADRPWCNPDLDEKAAYHVARSLADEIPNVDQAAARRIGARFAKRLFDLFPESL